MIFLPSFANTQNMSSPQQLNIVVISCASSATQKGQMPLAKDIESARQHLEAQGIGMRLVIIDHMLKYAVRIVEGRGGPKNANYENDAAHIQSYRRTVDVFDEHVNKVDERVDKALGEWKLTPETTIYIVYSSPMTPVHSSYDIMSLIDCYVVKNRYFLALNKDYGRISLTKLVEEYTDIGADDHEIEYLYPEMCDLYAGGRMPLLMPEADIRDTFKQVVSACGIIHAYYQAGYDRMQNLMTIPGWCLNPETPFIKGCILTYGIISPIPDSTAILQITSNSGFRFQLFEVIRKVIAAFVINNGILTSTDIKARGGWNSPATYTFVGETLRPLYETALQTPTSPQIQSPTTSVYYTPKISSPLSSPQVVAPRVSDEIRAALPLPIPTLDDLPPSFDAELGAQEALLDQEMIHHTDIPIGI